MDWPGAIFGIFFTIVVGTVAYLTQQPKCLWALIILALLAGYLEKGKR